MRALGKIPLIIVLVLLAPALFFLNECNKTSGGIPDPGYAYYPLAVGDSITYLEDSIIYDDFFSTIDTFHHEVMDVTASTFLDNSGRLSYLVNRYIFDSIGQDWQPDFSYYITPTPTRIEDLENDLRYIKLIFPVQMNATWSGNSFIDPNPNENLSYLEGWNYQYTAVNTPDTVNNQRFDSTLTVLQQPNQLIQTPDFSSQIYSVELYAKNVGLIYKHFIYWQQQCVSYDQNGNCLQLGGKGGYEVIMQILSHN